MARRKKKYVQYDYEAVYSHQADMEDEYEVQQLLKGKSKKTIYATKEIRAGEQLEIEIYPEFVKGQEPKILTEDQIKKQKLAQWNLNEKNSRKMCERTINENFGDRDIWATLTYTDDQIPETMEEADRNMHNYIRRLNYRRKKQGL